MSNPMILSVAKNNTAPFVLSVATLEPFVLRDVNPGNPVTLQMGPSGTGAVSLQGPPGEPSIRGLSGFVSNLPLANEYVVYGVAPYDFELDALECKAVALSPATNQVVFNIYRADENDIQVLIGTATFAIGQDTATFSFTETIILKNEKLIVQAPSIIDATLSNITFLLV